MTKILLVEDEVHLRLLLKTQLTRAGYDVDEAGDLKTAGRKIRQYDYDVIIQDQMLPDGNSISLLDKFPARMLARTIIITANPTIPGVVEAIKKGAHNYLEKPVDPRLLIIQCEKVMEINRLRFENHVMAVEMASAFSFDSIIYESKQMDEVISRARILAETDNTVLILGETGVGKEVLAHAVHNHSLRKKETFLPVNCAAIPPDLFESELFGFEKGAFTGAASDYKGRFIQADKGTLFLDEIGELPLAIQAKLLRILDERRIYRLKSPDPIPVDVRLIAATNQDLEQDVKTKQFRGDLFYRLRESMLIIPPLREREDDILPLFRYFLKMYNRLFNKDVQHISREAQDILINHQWAGNVRELKNTVKGIMPFKTNDTIDVEDLSPVIMGESQEPKNKLVTLEQMENDYILKVLKITRFNFSQAAEILGVARSSLYRKLDQLDIKDAEK